MKKVKLITVICILCCMLFSGVGLAFGDETGASQDSTAQPANLTQDSATSSPAHVDVSFSDIDGYFGKQEILLLAGAGLISGYPGGVFRPNAPITRQEFTTLIVNTFMVDPQDPEALKYSKQDLPFTDNRKIQSWARPYVALACREKIIGGYPDKTFRPNAYISRQEMAALIIRTIGLDDAATSYTGEMQFADDDLIQPWARGYVALANRTGIMLGRSGNKFAPLVNTTRGETAVLMVRTMGLLSKASD